jgi:hypothetical protein
MAAVRRIGATVVVAFLWVTAASVLTAPPASAHSVAGVAGTNYRTRLLSVTPSVPDLKVRVIETGSRLELSNKTGQDAVVLGYQSEPYLRVGSSGVFENLRSPATYLNATRKGTTPVPSTASPAAAPEWHKISSATTARWHDHRIHWMGNQNPPIVRRAPSRQHVIVPEWDVQVRLASGQTVAVKGDLVWVPGPTTVPWLVLGLMLLGAAVLAGMASAWAPLIAVLLSTLVAVDVVHEVGIAFANAGPPGVKLARLAVGSLFSIVAWVIAVLGVRALSKRPGDGLLMAAFAAVVIALFGGLGDLTSLFSSQLPFAFSGWMARAAVAVSLGLGFGLAAGAVLAIVRHRVFDAEEAAARDAAERAEGAAPAAP